MGEILHYVFIFILWRVCTLWADVKANKVMHFLDSLSNDIVSLGYQVLKWSRTLGGAWNLLWKTFLLCHLRIYVLLLGEIVPLGSYLKFRIVPLSYMFVFLVGIMEKKGKA
jgi:hypothetical protein